MKPIITISIAAYNMEKYLRTTLDSLKNEIFNDRIEVLIIDDGSKDATKDIGYEYEKMFPNIFHVISKPNGGYGSTINESLKVAKGKYFKLLDGDDWFDTANLEHYLDYLEQAEADWIITDYTCVYEKEGASQLIKSNIETNKVLLFDEVASKFSLAMHQLTTKTSILKDNKIRISEHCFFTDVEYCIKQVPFVRTIEYLPLNIYCYRLGREGQSMEIAGSLNHYRDHENVIRTMVDYIENFKTIVSKEQLEFMEKRISEMATRQYYLYLLMKPSKLIKEQYIAYDKMITKNYPLWRNMPLKENSVKISLVHGGLLYPPIAIFNRVRFNNKL